jgi:HAD superfamily hydrolase (TIGR01509 family)
MDGLLVDSEPLARRSWEKVFEPYGVDLDDETYGSVIGMRLEETASIFQSRLHIPAEPGELARQKEAYLAQLSTAGIPPMPGLARLMDELQERQIPWAVATSNRRAFASQVLKQLNLWPACKSLTTGEEVRHGKPAPDIYLLAAERMGVAPGACLALEDSVPGAKAAKTAGMLTIAVPGAHEKPAAFDFADFVYDSLDGVAQDLDALLFAGSPSTGS